MGTDVEIMSERMIIERVFQDLLEMKREQSEMKVDVSEMRTDIRWIRESVEKIGDKVSACRVCANPEEIVENHNKLKKIVFEIKDSLSQIKWTAAGISAGISLVILIIAFLYKLKST